MKIYDYLLIIGMGLSALIVIYLKGVSSPHNLIAIYTVAITTFMFSRVIISFYYRDPVVKESFYRPSVTVTIPCKNEEASIRRTMVDALSVDYPKHKLELIVVNDSNRLLF